MQSFTAACSYAAEIQRVAGRGKSKRRLRERARDNVEATRAYMRVEVG